MYLKAKENKHLRSWSMKEYNLLMKPAMLNNKPNVFLFFFYSALMEEPLTVVCECVCFVWLCGVLVCTWKSQHVYAVWLCGVRWCLWRWECVCSAWLCGSGGVCERRRVSLTVAVDSERRVLCDDLVVADLAVLRRTVSVCGVDLQDAVTHSALLHRAWIHGAAEHGGELVHIANLHMYHCPEREEEGKRKGEGKKENTSFY